MLAPVPTGGRPEICPTNTASVANLYDPLSMPPALVKANADLARAGVKAPADSTVGERLYFDGRVASVPHDAEDRGHATTETPMRFPAASCAAEAVSDTSTLEPSLRLSVDGQG